VPACDVPDVVQDIFARLIPTLARFQFDATRGQFRTWLWRVARNAAMNWRRKQANRARTEATWRDRCPPQSTNDDLDEWGQHRRLLNQVLVEVRRTTLPATWACFVGRILCDRPAVEVAVELGISQNTVYVNASRVLARVRERCVRQSETTPATFGRTA
jgi:RNA polymerase sigma-70 factor (ECF subfamily)